MVGGWLQELLLAAEARVNDGEEATVDVRPLSSASPLCVDAFKAEYGHVLTANAAVHLEYLRVAAAVILSDLKRVLLQSHADADARADTVAGDRPDPLGAVRPPDTEEVTALLRERMSAMAPGTVLDGECVREQLDALDREREFFRRENVVNNAFESAWSAAAEAAPGRRAEAGAFVLPADHENWTDVALGAEPGGRSLSVVHPGVAKRGPGEPAAWRPPPGEPAFPFTGLWGFRGGGVDSSALRDFRERVATPHAGLAAAAAVATTHVRLHVRAAHAVLFGGGGADDDDDNDDEEEDNGHCADLPEGYRDGACWRRLLVTLDWLSLVWRMVAYAYSCTNPSALAALLESWPPVLFDDDWLYEVLLAPWPDAERPCPPDPRKVASLISAAVAVPSRAVHPVFGDASDRMRWHRLSIPSGAFLCSAVLGRASREEAEGTQMLVRAAGGRARSADAAKGGGEERSRRFGTLVLPSAAGGSDSNPFLTNPLYRTRTAWTGEPGAVDPALLARLCSEGLRAMSPLLEWSAGSPEWTWLGLVPIPQLDAVVGRLWRQLVRRRDDTGGRLASDLLGGARRNSREVSRILDGTVSRLGEGLRNHAKNVEKSERVLKCANALCEAEAAAAETALYNLAVWVETVGAVFDHL